MTKYIPNVLLRFKYSIPTKRPQSPHIWEKPVYGHSPQLALPQLYSPKLPEEGILHVQQVVGSLLYHTLAVDCTLLVALGKLGFK